MNIKSLLLGSAAALAAVSGAQAADAIVAAEPEPMEYVRVCDAFGTGYFYIPGTETCLKIGGYVRFQVDIGDSTNGFNGGDWDAWTRGRVEVTSKSDTELGTLTGFIAIHGESSRDNSGSSDDDHFYFDEVYIELGGFKVGDYLSWWDNDLPGELDLLSNQTRFTSVSYTYTGEAFTAMIQADEISNEISRAGEGQEFGIQGGLRAALGPANLELLGAYDNRSEDGAVRAIGSIDAGPGTFYLSVLWSSDPSVYYEDAEWTVAANYVWKATDKLEVIPEFQYFWNTNIVAGSYDDGGDDWAAGLTVNYQITEGLRSKFAVGYGHEADEWAGLVRLQRDF
ncbi:porin [Neorhizobium petrolearium]|uniref:Porin n=1 Tax=Neorhizobium petrolearium TaxID=515361 RepID=A0ABY8M7C3_9HYPH|nr:porin [Neorhizobium petrolearium]MCC2609119.1 porin [Neorhizobium petrolearium]WGI69350.1 porin [Neorhizobium petrolearium]